MLVLSRTTRQQLVIDGQITITILEIKGRRARIGIEAPDTVRIIRGELAFDPPSGATKADTDATTTPLPRACGTNPTSPVATPSAAAPRSSQTARSSGVVSEWRVPAERTAGASSATAGTKRVVARRSPLAGRVARRQTRTRMAPTKTAMVEPLPQAVAI